MEKSKCQCSSSSSIRGEQQKIEWWEWGRLGWGRSQLNLKWGPTIFIFHIFFWFSKSLTISFNFQSLSQFLLVFNIFHNFSWLYSFFTIFFIFNLSNNFFWFLQTLLIFANFKCSLWFLFPLIFTILTVLFPFPDSNLKDFYVFIFHWHYYFVWEINFCKTLFFVTKTASLFTTMMTICDCDEECELCMWQRWDSELVLVCHHHDDEDQLWRRWKNCVADFAFLHAGRPFDLNMNCLLDIASFATNIIICDLWRIH